MADGRTESCSLITGLFLIKARKAYDTSLALTHLAFRVVLHDKGLLKIVYTLGKGT